MPLSNSVIRRYTPPTCTLEVWAQSSPLSRWMGKTVLKQLNFELRFHNPQLPEENWVVIRGDRDQLEALYDAVTSYVQEFLHQTPDHFWVSFSGPQDSSKVADESALTELQQSSLASTKTLKAFNSPIPGTKIYLEPSNYLTHNLYLGSLASQAPSPVIQLSLLQLFDLATALDEYSAEVMALPNLHRSSSLHNWPAWTSVAAVLALGVGLLPVTWQYVNQTQPKKQQLASKSASESTDVAIQPSPALNLATPQPGLTPADTFPQVPGLNVTPPPPSSSLPVPPLSVPNPAAPPGAVVGISPGNKITLSQNPQFPTFPKTSGQPVAISPPVKSTPPGIITSSEVNVPIKRNLPPSLSPSQSNLPSPLPAIPNSNTVAAAPINPPPLPGELNQVSTNPSVANEQDSLATRLRNARQAESPKEVATSSTLFDTPLVAEAREYVQKRWQPPSGLTDTLEYSLVVAVDGTVERILPLNKAAREYIDSTGIPSIGKPFVSPSKVGRSLRIRAVLSPDGKVKVLPENE